MVEIPHKRGKRASFYDVCLRCWVRHKGRIIRYLSFTSYEPFATYRYGEPREFIFVLLPGDKRPRGIEMKGYYEYGDYWGDLLLSLPIGQWVELSFKTKEAA